MPPSPGEGSCPSIPHLGAKSDVIERYFTDQHSLAGSLAHSLSETSAHFDASRSREAEK